MEISLDSVRDVFQALLAGRMSREDADRWAYGVIQKNEAGALVFVPVSSRQQIWAGVMFLNGVDTQISPGQYLHDLEDIEFAMREKLGS